jgi:ubiquitin-like protein ATG12
VLAQQAVVNHSILLLDQLDTFSRVKAAPHVHVHQADLAAPALPHATSSALDTYKAKDPAKSAYGAYGGRCAVCARVFCLVLMLLIGADVVSLSSCVLSLMWHRFGSLSPHLSHCFGILVVVRFKSIGSAPVMKNNVFKVTAGNKFQAVIVFLRGQLGIKQSDALVSTLRGSGVVECTRRARCASC